ncbi:type VI secretion system contractile sheath large subunit, partial [candidate division KSB1 bacterium]
MNDPKTTQATEVATSTVDKLVGMLDTEDQKNAVEEFIKQIGDKYAVERINSALIDSYIESIDKVISAQMDEILHNEDF